MSIQFWMNYTIFFREEADYQSALALSGGNPLVSITPRAAAALFGIPYPYPSGNLDAIPKGITFYSPFTPGSEFFFPLATGIFVDDTILDTYILSQNGSPVGTWPGNPAQDGIFTWSAIIMRAQGDGGSAIPSAIPERKWIMGFEWGSGLENPSVAGSSWNGRDCSRTLEGCGFPARGTVNTGATAGIASIKPAGVNPLTWERFYIRFRKKPTTFDGYGIWRCRGTPSTAVGYSLRWMLDGTVHGFTENAGVDRGVVFTPLLNVWYKIDILIRYNVGNGRIRVYINGVDTFTDSPVNATTNHANSDLGKWNTTAGETVCEYDLDDWVGAELPGFIDPITLLSAGLDDPSIDWLMGSHIRKVWVIGGTSVDWTGPSLAVVNQGQNAAGFPSGNFIASVVAQARIDGLTDLLPQTIQDMPSGLSYGVACISVGQHTQAGLSITVQSGINILGTTDILANITSSPSALSRNALLYSPVGKLLPDEIFPLTLVHVKSNDATNENVYALALSVEHIGYWGPEDDSVNVTPPVSRLTNLHNCHYANSIWGSIGAPIPSPVFSVGFTYNGNDTYQEFTLPAPPHFIFIHKVASGNAPLVWFGASLGSHSGDDGYIYPAIRVWSEINGDIKFSIAGSSANFNATGQTYEVIAFCDPGGRYNLCGAFAKQTGQPSPDVISLFDPGFDAEAMFATKDLTGNTSDVGVFYKGPGQPGSQGRGLGPGADTVKANFATFGGGQLSLESDTFVNSANWNWGLWRSGEPGCSGTMVQICSYTGDGTNPRTINITPVSGRYPLMVLIVPSDNADAIIKTVAHGANKSSHFSTNNQDASGPILSFPAPDQVTVNLTLNANGVDYDVFALPGDDAGPNNGIFYNLYCEPPDGGFGTPTPINGDVVQAGEGGITLDGESAVSGFLNIGGIYTLVRDKRHDTLMDRLPGQPEIEAKIPNPMFKTGYIGG